MKAAYLVLAISSFVFLALAITLDLGSLVTTYPQYDLSSYLAARSLARDGDLAYSSADSDRYFREHGQRPSHFQAVKKKVISRAGEYREYPVFYAPGIYTFLLIPFVAAFGFHGVLLLQ